MTDQEIDQSARALLVLMESDPEADERRDTFGTILAHVSPCDVPRVISRLEELRGTVIRWTSGSSKVN